MLNIVKWGGIFYYDYICLSKFKKSLRRVLRHIKSKCLLDYIIF